MKVEYRVFFMQEGDLKLMSNSGKGYKTTGNPVYHFYIHVTNFLTHETVLHSIVLSRNKIRV